jgi:ADP-ribosylglycohydrolase
MTRKDKIFGCLIGAAAGDAMGAATETRTREQIREKFGGYVRDFIAPPPDTFARGNEAGQITDDFSVAYITCRKIIAQDGIITTRGATEALLEWAAIDKYFSRFAGPTTRAAVAALRGEPIIRSEDFVAVNDNAKATNGAAMKIAPIALFSGGDVDKAIHDAVTVGAVTHGNNIALSAAAAVAAATARALKDDANLFDVLQAGLYGAREGDRIGREKYHTFAGASVEKRIAFALELATLSSSLDEAIEKIGGYIGSGLMAAEAVPAVFGIIAAAGGDPVEGICAGVNIGNDTDTVATMVGGILGALKGSDAMPAGWLALLEQKNEIDLAGMAEKINGLIG